MASSNFALAQSSSVPVIAGYRDFNFATGNPSSEPTEEKAESKVWYHDGFWWAVMWDSGVLAFRIHRLDSSTQSWSSTGPNIDTRPKSSADVLSVGSSLYMSSRAKLAHKTADGPETAILLRLTYDSASQTYSIDTGFPVDIPGTVKTPSLTIARDTNGKLWATWFSNQKVMVNRSLTDDSVWGTAFELPGQGNLLTTTDVSAVTAFGAQVGIAWSNQNDRKIYFMVHHTDSVDTVWETREDVIPGSTSNVADNHLNFACSPTGTVALVNKTSTGTPEVYLNLRDATTGSWTNTVAWVKADDVTRPVAVINSDTDSIYVIVKSSGTAPKSIHMKSTHLSSPVFSAGLGRVIIKSIQDDNVNNPTSTKDCVTNATGLLVLASDKTTKNYLHSFLDFNNEAPRANDDNASTNETTPVAINVAANDTDADGTVDVTSVVVVLDPINGAASVDASTGAITYTPDVGFSGADSLYYTVSDNGGANAIAAVVRIDVNDSPVAADDSTTTEEETLVAVDVLANDSDSDGAIDPTSVVITKLPANGSATVNPVNGVITYTPSLNFAGVDTLSYTVKDDSAGVSNEANLKITVSGQNDPPLALNDTATTDSRTSVVIPVTANDTDPETSIDKSSLVIAEGPGNGTALADTSTGSVSYTPTTGFFGLDSLKYTVDDATGLTSNLATVFVNVGAVPLAVTDSATTQKNTTVVIDVLANDSDPDGTLVPSSVTIVQPPALGSTSVNGTNGFVTFTPFTDFTGNMTFTYTVGDNDGTVSDTTGVVVKVNQPPTASDDFPFTTKATQVEIDVLANDTDADGSIDPSSIVLTFGPFNGTFSLNPTTGILTYVPNVPFSGTDIFGYTVDDDNGATSEEATVSVRVNNPPTAVTDQAQTDEDTPVSIAVTSNDVDTDGTIVDSTVTIVTAPTNGTVAVDSTNGMVTYTPNSNYFGPDALAYTVKDNEGTVSNPGQVTITVNAVNDAPIVVNDTLTTAEEVPVILSVLTNDTDIDGSIVASTLVVTRMPDNGSASLDGSTGEITYTPDIDFVGTDTLAYHVDDDAGATSNTAQVLVVVTSLNDPPVAVTDIVSSLEDVPIAIRVTENDTDVDGSIDTTSVVILEQPLHGTANLDPGTGVITYLPSQDFFGRDTLAYSVNDDIGASDSAQVLLTVANTNDSPVAANDTVTTQEETTVTIDVAQNDFDVDGIIVPSSVTIVAQPPNGVAGVGAAPGSLTYTPALNFVGVDTLTYTIDDDSSATSMVGTVSINVTNLNDPPIAVNDTATTPEESAAAIVVLGNDVDIDGLINSASVTVVTQPLNGVATVSSNGIIIYIPGLDFVGVDSLRYTVEDQEGLVSTPASVFVTVTNLNDPPIAVNDTVNVTEDVAKVISVSDNDLDIDGTVVPATVSLASQPLHGSTSVDGATGEITYSPDSDFFGVDSLTYSIQDDGGAPSNVATVRLNVSNVNDPPIAVNDTTSTEPNLAVSVLVIANDKDNDGTIDPASILAGPSSHGTTSVKANGEITYTPNLGFQGMDSLFYSVRDDSGAASNLAQLFIDVVSTNDVPVAVADTVTTSEDVPIAIDVTSNDSDTDGSLDLGSVTLTVGPENGIAGVDTATGKITYAPAKDFSGQDSLKYTVRDNLGTPSNEAAVSITVNPVNDPPVAFSDSAFTLRDTPVTIRVIDNDQDVDGTVNGASVLLSAAQNGTTVLLPNGDVVYTPAGGFSGSDSLTYSVEDDQGAVSNSAGIFITITAPNEPPVAVNDTAATDEDVAVVIVVTDNDTDLDGTVVVDSVRIESAPTQGSAILTTTPGEILYSPGENFFGTDSLKYSVVDNEGARSNLATVLVTVNPVVDSPVASNDTSVTPEDTPVQIAVIDNDVDPDGSLDPSSVTVVTAALHGSAIPNTSTGAIAYTPALNFNGSDSLSYTVADNDGNVSNQAHVLITVTVQNDAPVARGDTVTTSEETAISINILQNDFDTDGTVDSASVTIKSVPENGSATINALTGEITYTPDLNFFGSDSLDYDVRDDLGLISNQARVLISVTNVNDAPLAMNDTVITQEEVALDIDVAGNDSDIDGTLDLNTVTIVTSPVNGTASITAAPGIVTYTPNNNFNGADSLDYIIGDNDGLVSNTARVFITVTGQNDAPLAKDDTVTTSEDTEVSFDVLQNDFDIDGTLDSTSVMIESGPANGSATVDALTGEIKYNPNLDFSGSDSLKYNVLDDLGLASNQARVLINVTSINDAPRASNDTVSTQEEVALDIDVAGNDSDVDGTLDLSTVTTVTQPVNGTASVSSANGVVIYTPNINFSGADSLDYIIADNDGLVSNTARVFITVIGQNDPPVAAADAAVTDEDVPVTVDILTNDADPDGSVDATSVTIDSGPNHGTASVSTVTGELTYTPAANFFGLDTLFYHVADDLGAISNTALLNLTILDVNDPPVAVNDAAATGNVPVDIDLIQNDSDIDGTVSPASVVLISQPLNGSVSLNGATGRATYTPNSGFEGQDNFTYRVSDDDGAESNTASVVVVVTPPSNFVFESVEDGQVKLSEPLSNYGAKGTAKVDLGKFRAYYKFNVSGLSGNVESAVLRLQVSDGVSDGSDSGGTVNLASNSFSGTTQSWTEAALAAGNAPDIVQGTLETKGPVASNEIVEFDVSAVVNGDGVFSFCITGNSTDQVKYYTKEGTTSQKPELVILTSSGGAANNAPIAFNDTVSTSSNTPVAVDVAGNDVDSDGTLALSTVSIVTPPGNGFTTTDGVTGIITYNPANGFKGTDVFEYTIKDNSGAISNPALVIVDVAGVNVPPVAKDDTVTTSAGSAIVANVLSNDSDSDGTLDASSVALVSGPAAGVATVTPSGTISYTPNSGFLGVDSLAYTVKDNDGDLSNSATLVLNVIAGNVPPVAIGDTTTTNANIGINIDVTVNDSDADGFLNVGSVTIETTPANGTATVNTANGLVTYNPDTGFSGLDTFSYTVQDNQGAKSNTATVLVTVVSQNAPPVAANDAASTSAGQAIEIAVLSNDTDSDGTLDGTTVAVATGPANGSTAVNSPGGSITYTPNGGFVGQDSFTYTVRDNEAALSNQATVSVNVTAGGLQTVAFGATDDAQVKLTDGSKNYGSKSTAKVEAGQFSTYLKFSVTGLSGSVQKATVRLQVGSAASDASVSGGNIFQTSVNFRNSASAWTEALLTSGNAPEVTGAALSSLASVSPLQMVEFDVTPAIVGDGIFSFCITSLSNDQAKYFTKEGATAPQLVVTTIGGSTNIAPVANDDSATTAANTSVIVAVTNNDIDADGTLDKTTVTVGVQPNAGNVQVDPVSGDITYSPNVGFSGIDTFTYSIEDNEGTSSNAATVSITVGSGNSAPVALNDTATTVEEIPVVVDILANDSDPDGTVDATRVSVTSNPSHGSIVINSISGVVTYTPNSGFTGNDGFGYTVRDNAGDLSNEAAVVLIVNPTGGGSQTVTFQPTDDGQVKLSAPLNNYGTKSTSKVEQGKFTSYYKFVVGGLSSSVQKAVLRLQVTDGPSDGGDNGGSVFLAANTLPGSSTPWTESVLTSGDAPNVSGSALSTAGAVTPLEFVDFDVTSAVAGNGTFSFCIVGNSPNQVKYFTKEGASPPQLIVATGSGSGNLPPTAVNDNAVTVSGSAVEIDVTSNDSDVDGSIVVTTVAIVAQPTAGTSVVDGGTGRVTYTPGVGFSGQDTFSYTVQDNDGATSNAATVTVTVSGGNIPPVAVNDIAATSTGVPIAIDVTLNDTDSDGTLIVGSIVIVTGPANGTASLDVTTGVVTYNPGAGFSGNDSFTYTVQDNDSAVSNAATVAITVSGSGGGGQTLTFLPTDDAQVKITSPATNYGTKTTSKAQANIFTSYYKFNVTSLNDAVQSAILRLSVTDPSSAAGSIFSVSNSLQGSSTSWTEQVLTAGNAPLISGTALSSAGAVNIGDLVDFDVTAAIIGDGVYSFAIQKTAGDKVAFFTKEGTVAPRLIISTGSGGGGGNSPPVAVNDNASTTEGIPVSVGVTTNDSDSDGTLVPSSVLVTTAPSDGVAVANSTPGVVTYTPNAGFSGTDSFSYTVLDNDGAVSNAALVTVTVLPSLNQPPTAVDNAATVSSGSIVTVPVVSNDFDPDGSIANNTVAVIVAPANGTTSLNVTTGAVTYISDAGFVGVDTFGYTVRDDAGATSNTATVTITVTGGQGETMTFNPTDDGQVKLTAPGTNYGTKNTAKVEQSKFSTYFKFSVSGITSSVVNAKLRLKVTSDLTDGGDKGGSVFAASNLHSTSATPWTEAGLTAGNAPDITSGVLSSVGALLPNDIAEFDVTAAITGNGTFSFCLQGDSQDQVKYFMKEGAVSPELVVQSGGTTSIAQISQEVISELSENPDTPEALPKTLSLGQNYPNPFNPATNIRYALPEAGQVKLMIFNITGQLVKTLVDGEQTAGFKTIRWQGKDSNGRNVSSGIYFVRLDAGEQKFSRRIILQK